MKFCLFVLKIWSGNRIRAYISGHFSGTNVRKMMCNNPNVDLAYMNAYMKFGEIHSICSQDIERKRNFETKLWDKPRATTLVQMCENGV